MKKDMDKALHGKSRALGRLHMSTIGTDEEGEIDNHFTMFLRGWRGGQAPLSLEYLHPH